MKRLLLLVAVIGLLASCRSSRTISRAISKKETKDTVINVVVDDTPKVDTQRLISAAVQQLQNRRIPYTTFNAKVDVDYRGMDGKKYDVNTNIRMYKDSALWVSVNAVLGIEAMRLLVTRDSVKLLNKLEKTYTARSIQYLQDVTSLPLDLYTLQDLIIGNPVFVDSSIIRYSAGGGTVTLVSLGAYFKTLIALNEADFSIIRSKLDDTDPTRSRTADLTYGDYETKKGPLFATKRQIVVSEKARLDIKLSFKNYDFNEPVDFPFSIPKNYRRD